MKEFAVTGQILWSKSWPRQERRQNENDSLVPPESILSDLKVTESEINNYILKDTKRNHCIIYKHNSLV